MSLHRFYKFRSTSEATLPTPDFPDGLKELYRPDNPVVDICFVHGLTGDREKTWTAEGQSASWPETLLPGAMPHARILTFGYDAYIVKLGMAGTNGLLSHATNLLQDLTRDRMRCRANTRPLIFVAHSLGGLVCKKALLASRDSPEEHLRGVFDSVLGIAFMGTPHRGSWMASWAKIPVTSLGFFKSKNSKLLDVLRTDSQFLEDVRESFVRMLTQRAASRAIEVACYYEEKRLPAVGVVVSKDSATMEGKLGFSIPANHMDMVRFASEDDPGFDRLLGELQRWTQALGNAVELSPEMGRIHKTCLTSLFFREMDMRSADVQMATPKTCSWLLAHEHYCKWVAGQGLLLVKGKPGSGKSTLLKYAWTNMDTGDDIALSFFFHGRGSALQNTPMGFLQSVSHQLLAAAPFTVLDLVDAYQKNHTQKLSGAEIDVSTWVWTEQDLQGYLTLALQRVLAVRPVWLFVDALDESSEPNSFFRWLQDLCNRTCSENSFPCHFLASCRHSPVLLVKDGTLTICTEDKNARDIATYVNFRFENDGISEDIRNSDIPGLIVKRASGIFLWARLVMDGVLSADLGGRRVSDVRNIVNSTPDTLTALYARQVEGTKGDEDFVELMFWACFSRRPLSLEELCWVLAMNGTCNHQSLQACEEAGDVLPLDKATRYVNSVGKGLLEVTHLWTVQFIHQTARDFMQNTGLPAFLGEVSPAEAQRKAHFHLAKASVRFIAMKDRRFVPKVNDYCRRFSLGHIVGCDRDNGLSADEVIELLGLMQWPSMDLIALWLTVFLVGFGAGNTSLVHWLAGNQAPRLMAAVMQSERGKDQVNTKDFRGTPLQIAVREDEAFNVRILLENGAHVHEKYPDGATPLSVARAGGSDSVVRVLLEYGADMYNE